MQTTLPWQQHAMDFKFTFLHHHFYCHSISPKNCGCNKSLSYCFFLHTYTSSLQYVPSVLTQLQVTEVSSLIVVPMYLITYFYFSYLYSFSILSHRIRIRFALQLFDREREISTHPTDSGYWKKTFVRMLNCDCCCCMRYDWCKWSVQQFLSSWLLKQLCNKIIGFPSSIVPLSTKVNPKRSMARGAWVHELL